MKACVTHLGRIVMNKYKHLKNVNSMNRNSHDFYMWFSKLLLYVLSNHAHHSA